MNRRWCCKKVILILDRKQASDCSCVNWLHIIGGGFSYPSGQAITPYLDADVCVLSLLMCLVSSPQPDAYVVVAFVGQVEWLTGSSCEITAVTRLFLLWHWQRPPLPSSPSTSHPMVMADAWLCGKIAGVHPYNCLCLILRSIHYINKYVFTNRNHSLAVFVNHRAVPVTFGTTVVFGKAFHNKNQGVAPTALLKCQFLRVLCSSQWYVRVFSFLSCTVR